MVARVARRQVLVQLDDELVARLDRTAAALDVNRSELIRRALHAYTEACEEAGADARYVEAYLRIPEDLSEHEGLRALSLQAWPEN